MPPQNGSAAVCARSWGRRIRQFVEQLVPPRVVRGNLVAAYQSMAADERREADAYAWAEATTGDAGNGTQ
jgi:hypothetical protein